MEFFGSSKLIMLFFLGSILIVFTLPIFFSKPPIYKNDYAEHVLEILHKLGFDTIYFFITTLLKSNNLDRKESC